MRLRIKLTATFDEQKDRFDRSSAISKSTSTSPFYAFSFVLNTLLTSSNGSAAFPTEILEYNDFAGSIRDL